MYFIVNSAYHVVRQYITRLTELPSIKRFVRFNCNRFRCVFMKNTIKNQVHFILKRDLMYQYLTNIYIRVHKTVKLYSKRKFPALVYVLLILIDSVFKYIKESDMYRIYLDTSFLICLSLSLYIYNVHLKFVQDVVRRAFIVKHFYASLELLGQLLPLYT